MFDYKSRTVVRDIIAALAGRPLAGALAIAIGSAEACLEIVHACAGAKVVAMTTPSVSFDTAPDGTRPLSWFVPTMARLAWANVSLMLKARLRGIRVKYVFGTSLLAIEVGPMIYADFLPTALAQGRYRAFPEPRLVGHGLEHIAAAVAAQKKGVSARKLVVTL